ncbi:MAG: phage major capsid protein [Patescibacteria group bacterium]|nr:phage major capsid protein [Patescibacteria group bacterium]
MADLASQYQFFNTLQALTREGFVTSNVIDTVFKDQKFFQWLRQKDKVVEDRGGTALVWPLNVGRSPNTQAFWGVAPLNTFSMNTNIIRAALNWKAYADALVMATTDLALNNGSAEAVANIVDVQMGVVKSSLTEKLGTDVLTNTQAANPLEFNGLAEAVDNGTVATTYAGVSRTTYPLNWESTVNYAVPSTASLLNTIHSLDIQASIAGERPDSYFATPNLFATSVEGLFSIDRYMQPEMARTAGGYDFIFNGKPLYIDQYLPTGVAVPTGVTPPAGTDAGGYFYGLNSSYLKLVVHPDFNFAVDEWQQAQGNASYFARMYFFGNLVCLKPSANFVAWVQGG